MDPNSPINGGDTSVHIPITEDKPTTAERCKRVSIGRTDSIAETEPEITDPVVRAPEKKLTLFALRLAVLEKSATRLGTLGFIWATVVLLGGFAITLDTSDFWIITAILVSEATRIFSRSHELEWQQQSTTWSVSDSAGPDIVTPSTSKSGYNRQEKEEDNPRRWNNAKRLVTRRWESAEVPILPYAPWVFMARNISKILQFLQIGAAIACVALSLMKLIVRNFGDIQKGDTDKRNRKAALIIFYSLALAEAALFLLEKAYWQYKISFCKVFEQVSSESDLGSSGVDTVRRFFYHAYSKCVQGSIFDGLKDDMVSFAMELLGSESPDLQLIGAQILCRFSGNEQFSDDTLQKIGMSFFTVEKLVEMLNWKQPQEVEIRQSAAEILSKLAGKKQNSLRVAWIAGAMESIGSLLYSPRTTSTSEIGQTGMMISNLGLLIFEKLAREHENCEKIGNARDLLPKIIDFTHTEKTILQSRNVTDELQIQMVKRSLQVLKRLANSTGETGKKLRREISQNVFTIINIRDILQHGNQHPELQKLAIDILTSLAMEDEATQKIESTGGILKELLNIFLNNGISREWDFVRKAAGEALVMLALGSERSCRSIINLGPLGKLITALEDELLCVNAAGILRNLCTYSPQDCFEELKAITLKMSLILKGVVSEDIEVQEAMVGLAARSFKYMTCEESCLMFDESEVKEEELARTVIDILSKHPHPCTKFPRIRRFTIELAVWLMRDPKNVRIFEVLGLENELENVLDTTAEVESFSILSGSVGLSRFKESMQELVDKALSLLKNH